MTVLQWALKYRRFGWSTIPVKNKVPQLKSWMEYQKKLPTQEELTKWFLNSDNEIAIVTGQLSQLSVLDVDIRELPKWLLEKRINSRIFVRTPHGYHYYFKYYEGLKNYVKILENVDVRSEGGFVVAPPSPGYSFNRSWFMPSQLRTFPSNILAETTIKKTPLKGTGRIEELLNGLKEGNRDNSFTSLIGLMSRDGYSQSDIVGILSPHAIRVGFDNLEQKVEHIINDYPRSQTGYTHDDRLIESDNLSDFLADIRPVSWICEPILGMGTLSFVCGLPKTLKTWMMCDLALEVARGGKWLNRFPVVKGKVLFIDQERYRSEVQRRFKKMMTDKNLGVKDLEENLVLKSQTTTRIDLDESFNAFRRKLTEIKPTLIIVDSFATFHTRAENDRQDIQKVLERLKQLRSEFGCAIIMIDHENKSVLHPEVQGEEPNAFSMVGSVGKSAAAETVITVRKMSETESMVYHTASNLGPTIEKFKLTVRDIGEGIRIE